MKAAATTTPTTAPVKPLKYTVEVESGLPTALVHIVECLEFWNREGASCHENGKDTDFRDPEKNRLRKTIGYEDFILWMIDSDCQAFVNSHPEYISGKGGHHVWIADAVTKERLLILFFEVEPTPVAKKPRKKAFKVDKTYTHFAISKATNKIVDGWDYKGIDKESIKHYTAIDLKDNDRLVKNFKIVEKSKVIKSGIDPMDWNNWGCN
jgi:hypothetical protein